MLLLEDYFHVELDYHQNRNNESFEEMLEKEIASEINIIPEKSPKLLLKIYLKINAYVFFIYYLIIS